MPRPKTPGPIATFEQNLADATLLLRLAEALTNRRTYAMRRELRERVGEALRVPKQGRGQLDMVESDQLWVICKPGGQLTTQELTTTAPLLRGAVVSACAALETYVADKAIAHIGPVLASENLPSKMRDIPVTVGDWLAVMGDYKRPIWGVRAEVEAWITQNASTAPNKIGEVLSALGLSKEWLKRVDKIRMVDPGTTETELKDVTERRNRIAHSNDQVRGRKATLTVSDVREVLAIVTGVAHALEGLFTQRSGGTRPA